MKRKHKTYSKPKRPFDKKRLESEGKIKKEFGLKNKKEIWKAEAKINQIREQAKKLVKSSPEEQKKLFTRLEKIGIKVESIADVLSLTAEDYLKRRLQTLLVSKKLVNTARMARQLIVHKKVSVGGKIVNIPSYIVPVELEDKIKVKQVIIKPKKDEKKEIVEEEVKEDGEKNE